MIKGLENFRLRKPPGHLLRCARFIEPAAVYANSEAWDVDGFTLPDKDAAFAKLREIFR
jgi:hypothetical protein